MNKVYLDYVDEIVECEQRGLIPVVIFDNGGLSSKRIIDKVLSLSYLPDNVELKECHTQKNKQRGLGYLLCAQNEADALKLFRLRARIGCQLAMTARGKTIIPDVYGIDADGAVHGVTYMPLFLARGLDDEGVERLLNTLNVSISKQRIGSLYASRVSDTEVRAYLEIKNASLPAERVSIARARVFRLLASAWKTYDIELLDDRGGKNLDNILSYMQDLDGRYYARICAQREGKRTATYIPKSPGELGTDESMCGLSSVESGSASTECRTEKGKMEYEVMQR